jgi:predicted DNA-binding transcriptional regulator AlpA
MKNELQNHTAGGPAIERIPTAARRMGVSISQAYREIKAGRLGPLVKLGERASGLPVAAVDAWIQSKIDAAGGVK